MANKTSQKKGLLGALDDIVGSVITGAVDGATELAEGVERAVKKSADYVDKTVLPYVADELKSAKYTASRTKAGIKVTIATNNLGTIVTNFDATSAGYKFKRGEYKFGPFVYKF